MRALSLTDSDVFVLDRLRFLCVLVGVPFDEILSWCCSALLHVVGFFFDSYLMVIFSLIIGVESQTKFVSQ